MPRYAVTSATVTQTTGLLRFTYFTAKSSTVRTNLNLYSGSTAAAATPSLVRAGVYSVDAATGDLTRVATIASDTSIFAAANTLYTRALEASWTPVAGARYAFALLVVTAATAPTQNGGVIGSTTLTSIAALSPRLAASLSSQSDLPTSATDASLTNQGVGIFLTAS